MSRLAIVTATIADGQSLSGSASLGGKLPVGILAPAANWATAALSFQGSFDGQAWVNIYDDSGEYTTGALANGEGCSLNREVFRPWQYLKVRSGLKDAAVAQAAGDILTLILESR